MHQGQQQNDMVPVCSPMAMPSSEGGGVGGLLALRGDCLCLNRVFECVMFGAQFVRGILLSVFLFCLVPGRVQQ